MRLGSCDSLKFHEAIASRPVELSRGLIQRTARLRRDPASEPVCDVTRIAVSGDAFTQITCDNTRQLPI